MMGRDPNPGLTEVQRQPLHQQSCSLPSRVWGAGGQGRGSSGGEAVWAQPRQDGG